MLTFSHNHCGPRLGDDLIDYYPFDSNQEKLVEDYTAEMVTTMVTTMVAMVGEAFGKLAPVALHQGVGQSAFAVNRRNNREVDVPLMIADWVPLVGPGLMKLLRSG